MSVKPGSAAVVHNRKWYHHLYVQVLTAIVIGALLGFFYPSYGAAMKPLGDAFIANVWQPGAGVHANLGAIDTKSIQTFTTAAQKSGAVDYLLHIIPVSAIG